MSDEKNIEKLLREMGEVELPKGYDERFHAKLEKIDQPWSSHFINWIVKPSGIGWLASATSVLLVSLAILRQRQHEPSEDLAMIDEEIDMLDDLEILEHWNEEEQV